jgi:alpha-beta hydrolase superfamily lysophospholipase
MIHFIHISLGSKWIRLDILVKKYIFSGENRLQRFIYGNPNNNGLVVISHGLGTTADSYFPMIMFFVDNGWRVFIYNNTGTAGSEGENVHGLIQSIIDLDATLNYVKNSKN